MRRNWEDRPEKKHSTNYRRDVYPRDHPILPPDPYYHFPYPPDFSFFYPPPFERDYPPEYLRAFPPRDRPPNFREERNIRSRDQILYREKRYKDNERDLGRERNPRSNSEIYYERTSRASSIEKKNHHQEYESERDKKNRTSPSFLNQRESQKIYYSSEKKRESSNGLRDTEKNRKDYNEVEYRHQRKDKDEYRNLPPEHKSIEQHRFPTQKSHSFSQSRNYRRDSKEREDYTDKIKSSNDHKEDKIQKFETKLYPSDSSWSKKNLEENPETKKINSDQLKECSVCKQISNNPESCERCSKEICKSCALSCNSCRKIFCKECLLQCRFHRNKYYICDDCIQFCGTCSETGCRECIKTSCSECEALLCDSCVKTTRNGSKKICPNCEEEQVQLSPFEEDSFLEEETTDIKEKDKKNEAKEKSSTKSNETERKRQENRSQTKLKTNDSQAPLLDPIPRKEKYDYMLHSKNFDSWRPSEKENGLRSNEEKRNEKRAKDDLQDQDEKSILISNTNSDRKRHHSTIKEPQSHNHEPKTKISRKEQPISKTELTSDTKNDTIEKADPSPKENVKIQRDFLEENGKVKSTQNLSLDEKLKARAKRFNLSKEDSTIDKKEEVNEKLQTKNPANYSKLKKTTESVARFGNNSFRRKQRR